jgi:hypothetical protein
MKTSFGLNVITLLETIHFHKNLGWILLYNPETCSHVCLCSGLAVTYMWRTLISFGTFLPVPPAGMHDGNSDASE